MRLMITGPRAYNLGAQPILNALAKIQPTSLIIGGARGFDAWSAYAASQLEIPYDLVIPNWGYFDYYWLGGDGNKPNPEVMYSMVNHAEFLKYVGKKNIYVGTTHTNFIRNDVMLNIADEVLAGIPAGHRLSGGTGHAIRRAHQSKKIVHHI